MLKRLLGLPERIEFAAAFCTGSNTLYKRKGEYPKYPVETLVEGGDCEDKSILLAAILRAMGYRTALLVFSGNPGHIAVGVECPDCWGAITTRMGLSTSTLRPLTSDGRSARFRWNIWEKCAGLRCFITFQ